MIITFIAPPAAGKGTHALKVSQKLGIPHLSTGDLLRNVEDEKIKKQMLEGSLISDDTVFELLKERIKREDCKNGYVLDGFPRNLNQAKLLDEIIDNNMMVIILDLEKDVAEKRIIGRRSCPECGAVFNELVDSAKPKVSGICDNCSHELISRADDNIETFNERYQTYLKETYPLINYYEEKGIAYHVDSSKSIDNTFSEIEGILNDNH